MKRFNKLTAQGNVITYTTDFDNLVINAVDRYLKIENNFIPNHLEVSAYKTEGGTELYYLVFTDSYLGHGSQVDLNEVDHKEILEYCGKQKAWNSNKVKPELPNCLVEFNAWSLETETIEDQDLEND